MHGRFRKRFRNFTATLRGLPSAIVVGAQRAGTTSLYHHIVGHPQIARPALKEVHYFDLNFASGLDWYRAHFPFRLDMERRQAITIEATPYYIFHPCALQRIRQTLPEAKIVVLLRNPVDRAISHYFHEVEYGMEKLPLLEALRQEEDRLAGEPERLVADDAYRSVAHQRYSYKARGLYLEQIRRCFELFGQENTYIIQSEALFAATEDILRGLFSFLGLPPSSSGPGVRKGRPGSYRKQEVDQEAYHYLEAYYAGPNQHLYELLGREFDW